MGWHLGEGNLWCKMTNFENSVRVPLLVRAPWIEHSAGRKVSVPVEAVDLYRTLATLADTPPVEPGVDGKSLAPLLLGQALSGGQIARSQFPRCYSALNRTANTSNLPTLDRVDCQDVPRDSFDLMGYSMRTTKWRFTEWRVWDGGTLRARWDIPPTASELYAHAVDEVPFAGEDENIIHDPNVASEVVFLRAQLLEAFSKSKSS